MDTRTKAREDTGLQGVWEAVEHGLGEEELGAGKRAERVFTIEWNGWKNNAAETYVNS